MRRAILHFFGLMLAVLASTPSFAAKRVALVIGIDAYEHLPKLQKAVNDQKAVADALSGLGFEVVEGKNLTRREMNAKLAELDAKIAPGDTVFFYFAGHGVALGAENYLLPADLPKPKDGEENLVRDEGHSVDAIVRRVQGRGAAISFFVLDACRDNPIAATGVRSIGGTRGLTRMDAPNGVFLLYSAGIGQTALDRLGDDDPDANSVFTRKLVPLLKTPGLTQVSLAKRVQSEVDALASSVHHPQQPAYYDQIIGEIALSPGSAVGGAAPAVVAAQSVTLAPAAPVELKAPAPEPEEQVAVVTPTPGPVAPPKPVEPAVGVFPKPEVSGAQGDPVVRAIHKAVDERSSDGVFAFRDPKFNAELSLTFEKVNLVRKIEGYGLIANANFRDQDSDGKRYAIDFWFKPDGSDFKLMDIRVQKGPKREGDDWVMATRMPLAWWWLPTPGDAKTIQAWQVMSAIHSYIATNKDADGNLLIKDDKTGKTVPLEFVEIHQPVRHVKKTGQYFLCTDFRKPGSQDEYYDIDFWVDEKAGELQVEQVKMHQVPVQEDGIWTQVPRYNFGNLNFEVAN